jgi:hypothetical protein
MHSHCEHRFSYFYSFRILNPWKHRCPGCGVLITGGKRATVAVTIGILIGIAILMVALTMVATDRWTATDTLVWYGVALLVVVPPFQYWCWKWVRFVTKRDAT